ncbi:MAG TPA: methylmalonyl-CoA mutase family protein, partial [Acidimicrobiales bacterium]|nr:methylmalonyl-CoA mutase family protein [Acidimicrobiales bacterium]
MSADHELHVPGRPVRFVTAASLFDGHDAAINIMRRLLQRQGAEVVHLGHNRSVDEVVAAAVEEDVDGVAVSSYQGGHVEYFSYLVERLADAGRPDVAVFGGGGGVIVAEERELLHRRGVTRIFSPEDGQRLGLAAMVNTMVAACDRPLEVVAGLAGEVAAGPRQLARLITAIEDGRLADADLDRVRAAAAAAPARVLGVTGTGGSGKSSLTDELLRRFRLDRDDKLRIAVVAVDPTRRRGGGALLGDRIRMNALDADPLGGGRTYFRSLATRGAASEVPSCLPDVIAALKAAAYDLVIVETPGIGQGDAAIAPLVDVSLYVMTPEFGAASQLEKIDMLDFADVVAINKFERRGGADALRDVRRQLARTGDHPGVPVHDLPVFGTVASRFNDDGVTALAQELGRRLGLGEPQRLAPLTTRTSTLGAAVVPPERTRYLAEVATTVRDHHRRTAELAAAARRLQQFDAVLAEVGDPDGPAALEVRALRDAAAADLDPATARELAEWPTTVERFSADELDGVPLRRTSLSGSSVPRVALPRTTDHGDLVRYLRSENLPGRFPYTAGVFPLRRDGEDPARMFAGEGDAFRTNRRFHLLASGQPATRLSTAFDSVTLYGFDPAERPDIYGKVGNSGVSIATLDDMRALYDGFDLCDPSTSVSMTINGPAPTILAMFFATAVDQQVDRFAAEHGRPPGDAERAEIAARTYRTVRGTVQADILK